MIIDLLGKIGNSGSIAVGSLGIYVALRNQHRQLNAHTFIEFSKRFQELLRLFPTDAWLANRNPAKAMPPSTQEIRDCTLYAMQLIADVYRIHEAGYLANRVWKIWEKEIRNTITGPVFRREWQEVSAEFSHTADFVAYIDQIMREEKPRQRLVTDTYELTA